MAVTELNRNDVAAFLQKVSEVPAPKHREQRGRLIRDDATASQPTIRPVRSRVRCSTRPQRRADWRSNWSLSRLRRCRAANGHQCYELQGHDGVRCRGGQTQIAKVLDHTKREAEKRKVNALVFVGDALEEDIDRVCHKAGELGLIGVPMFLFHEGGDPIAERGFRELARLTGGAYCRFDAASAYQLRDLLSAVAVYAAGGRRALLEYGNRKVARSFLTHQVGGKG